MTWDSGRRINHRYQLQTLKRDRPGHQVWLAFDEHTQTQVILKTLSFTGEIQWDEVKLFEREAQILKRLSHPRIPKFIEFFSQEKPHFRLCLVECYIHAPSLQVFLNRQQALSHPQIWAIAIQVLEILQVLHQANPPILHRDIKPSNLLIDVHKQVYLIDFGAIGLLHPPRDAVVDLPTTVGSYGYTPMEQFMGQALPASDLYALGATLMQLLCGIPPSGLLSESFHLQLPDSCILTAPLRQWLEQLTEPQLQNRFSSATLALQALQNALSVNQAIQSSPVDSALNFSDRVTVKQTLEELKIEVSAVWNEKTIARNDLLVLVILAFLPTSLGVGAIALLGKGGLAGIGIDVLGLGLSVLPTVVLASRLIRNLLAQELISRPVEIEWRLTWRGIVFRRITLPWINSSTLQIRITPSERWMLVSVSMEGREHTLLNSLTAREADQIMLILENWRIRSQLALIKVNNTDESLFKTISETI